MEELKCFKCGKYLGEISKGKISKSAHLICFSCWEKLKTLEDLAEFEKGIRGGVNNNSNSMPDFMKDIFK